MGAQARRLEGPSLTRAAPHSPPASPMRTCIGCRKREARQDLVRVVLDGHHVVVDQRGTAPGRGAWLHPSAECLAVAQQRKAFSRALKEPLADASALDPAVLVLR